MRNNYIYIYYLYLSLANTIQLSIFIYIFKAFSIFILLIILIFLPAQIQRPHSFISLLGFFVSKWHNSIMGLGGVLIFIFIYL
jgi:hypothetical protein